ncbi:hypothetical protein [Desertivirga arenae]|uniref:hypothetical protein n=1 Tax=Desertivirga arenae TaxID=2810309 RepID=UPI001A96F786|nr:hypothetical protein [Pedobacter sp. SYSU D00823]
MASFDISKSIKITEAMVEESKKSTTRDKYTRMLPDESFVKNEYGKIFEIETTNTYQRIKVAADDDQIALLLKLGENLQPPYFILYVLLIPRQGNEKGRYQSEIIEDIIDLGLFLHKFKDFLETDGRHHIWIGTVDNSGLLIYDQHNVIYSYGQLNNQLATLRKEGFQEQAFSFPVPHAHHYYSENDSYEDELLGYWEWEIFPLTDQDTYEN